MVRDPPDVASATLTARSVGKEEGVLKMTMSTINAKTMCRMILAASLAGLGGCASQGPAVAEAGARQPSVPSERRLAEGLAMADLQMVDCQLPPRLHRLGRLVYLGSPREITTTVRDCAVRGGGPIASDPASSAT
jgi:hypothetical protein